MVSALALVVTTVFCFVFWQTVLGWLLAPARESHPGFSLKVFGPTESIGILFKIGMYGGLMLASPIFVYELLAFIVPGLTGRERKVILPAILGSTFFLLAGMAFAYWVILPASLGFLLDFGNEQLDPIIGAKQYMDFAIRIIFWVGISFELPMVMGIIGWLGLVRARQMLGFWRYGVVIVFIIAAVVTPTPDPYNQSLVAGPLLFLYFVGVLLAWLLQRKPGEATP
jgi:sec-independent protein translocase protein TatC